MTNSKESMSDKDDLYKDMLPGYSDKEKQLMTNALNKLENELVKKDKSIKHKNFANAIVSTLIKKEKEYKSKEYHNESFISEELEEIKDATKIIKNEAVIEILKEKNGKNKVEHCIEALKNYQGGEISKISPDHLVTAIKLLSNIVPVNSVKSAKHTKSNKIS